MIKGGGSSDAVLVIRVLPDDGDGDSTTESQMQRTPSEGSLSVISVQELLEDGIELPDSQ